MELKRRDFLKAAGAGAAGLVASIKGGDMRAFAGETREAKSIMWDEALYQSCGVCDSRCGMVCFVKDGRVKWVQGNPDEVLGSDGKLCVKGYSTPRICYDPDRLKSPLKRTNPRKGKDEDPGWVKISWEEAFKTVAENFNKAIAEHGPESVLMLNRKHDADTRLQKAIGTPNQVAHIDICFNTHDVAWGPMVTGRGRPNCPDLENAKYMLLFGWDQPGKSKMCFLNDFMKGRANGAKIVTFDPRKSLTARMGHEWIPIKPGTDLAVCLAMINVIIKEELYAKDYVAEYATGFEELAEHVRPHTPEWAAKISDVPADVITRIAREFAATTPAIIPNHKREAAGPNYSNSQALAMAQVCLSALVGGIETPGGQFMNRGRGTQSMDAFAPVEYPKMREERIDGQHLFPRANRMRNGSFATVAQGILSGKPYKVRVGIAKGYNLLSFPNPDTMEEAIKTLDFFVVCDILPTELCHFADIVMPDNYFLESGTSRPRGYMAKWPQRILREPVKPIWDTMGWGGIVNGILEAMGKSEFKVNWSAWDNAQLEQLGTTKAKMRENGGVWEDKQPLAGRTEFSTPSGKIELYSTVLEAEGHEPLPVWRERFSKPSEKYPYSILTDHQPWRRMGKQSNDALIAELQLENLAHIHPDTAAKIGVEDGEYVILDSPTGKSIKVKARVTHGIRPDCIITEHGYGYWSQELSVAAGKGACEGHLLPERKIEDTIKTFEFNAGMSGFLLDVCVGMRKA